MSTMQLPVSGLVAIYGPIGSHGMQFWSNPILEPYLWNKSTILHIALKIYALRPILCFKAD